MQSTEISIPIIAQPMKYTTALQQSQPVTRHPILEQMSTKSTLSLITWSTDVVGSRPPHVLDDEATVAKLPKTRALPDRLSSSCIDISTASIRWVVRTTSSAQLSAISEMAQHIGNTLNFN